MPASAASGSLPAVTRQSDRTIASRSDAGSLASCAAAVRRRGRVRPALAAQREQLVDDRRGTPDLALGLEDERVGGERDHARRGVLGARQHDRRSGHCREPDRVAVIEPLWSTSRQSARRGANQGRAIVGPRARGPRAPPASGRGRGLLRPRRRREPAVAPGAALAEPAGPGTGARRACGPGRAARGRSPRPCRRRARSRRRDRGQQLLERGLIEPADLGRNLLEATVAGFELGRLSVRRPAPGPRRAPGGAQRAAGGRRRGPAFRGGSAPFGGVGSAARAARAHSSGVRSQSSSTRTRPDIAATAASAIVSSLGHGCARRAGG